MNVFFQIAIGLCPAILVFLILTIVGIKKKIKGKAGNIIMLSAFSVAAIAMTITGLAVYSNGGELSTAKEDKVNLEIACAVAREGDYQLAFEMLDSMRANSADSVELSNAAALIYAANGDVANAKAMFIKANMLEPIDDYDEVIKLCDNALNEMKTAAQGSSLKECEKLKSYAKEKIETIAEESEVSDIGKVLIEAEHIYDDFLINDNLDEDKILSLVSEIDDACEENPELASNEKVRVCKVKLLALANKFGEIAEYICEDSGFDELAIAAELYINGLISDGDFSEKYGEDFVKMAKAVSKQLKVVRDKIPADEVKKLESLDRLVENLESGDSNPAISRLKMDITKHASDEKSPDRPKAYMQLARFEYVEGNDEAAADNISAALNTVGVSDDENFYTPMIGIVDSITDKDDIEKVKNIAQYAEDVTNNSSDYVVVKNIEQMIANGTLEEDDGYNSDEDGETDNKKDRNPFESFLADTASQKRNAFSITSVDATNFETVRLVVNVDPSISITSQELKKLITVKDCDVEITDFTVEKVEYKKANILLCCDVSGSMSGQPISDLKAAVQKFVETSSDVENIALVTFSGSVENVYVFGTDKDEIISAAGNLYSGGGTNMYGAIIESITNFSKKNNELNFILLMSDGADGYSPSMEDIQNYIGEPCNEKSIVLYSLGLGSSVNAEYMNTLAMATGGYFVYVNDSATLEQFYTNLRNQILNRYIITYKAKDTLRSSRDVTVSLNDNSNSNIVSDTKQYYMNGTDADASQDNEANDSIAFEGLSISGLETRRIYKNSNAVTLNLRGTKFTDKMSISVKLDGKLSYSNIKTEYVNETTLKLTLPGGMACGVYDLVVNINGKTGYLNDELTVSAKGTEKTTTFGNYVFTSDTKVENDNGVVLSGYVTMNGWLHFKGDVVITGNLTGQSVSVTDMNGSYIRYYTDSSTGLANVMAKNNIAVPLGSLGTFTIYNDTFSYGDSETHKVDKIPLSIVYLANVLEFSTPSVEIYPDKIVVDSNGFTTKLPMQDKILKAASVEDLFRFDVEASVTFTNTKIGMALKVSNNMTDDEENTYKNRVPANFGAMPIYTTPASYEIEIDTINNKYMIDISVKVGFIDSDGLGLKLEWGAREGSSGLQHLVPKTVEFKADFSINSTIGTVPVTYKDFKVGVEDIDPNKSMWQWKLTGGFDIETTKLSSFVPALSKYIGDPALFKLDDIKASLSLGQAYFSIETEAKLLDEITLGKLKIEAGKFSYTCEMLGMKEMSTAGMKASLTAGVIWNTDNLDIDISGTGVINLHTRFFGLEMQGKCQLKVSWWIFEEQFYQEGRALIGFRNDGQTTAFVIKARGTASKGAKDVYLYIDSNGVDCGVKKL